MTAIDSASESSVSHTTFVIDRIFDASPAQVFYAWADEEAKRRWANCHPDWKTVKYQRNFCVGGLEISHTLPPDGILHIYEAHFLDIVKDSRLVVAYSMSIGETRISSSLMTLEFLAEGARTRQILTEQIAVFDSRFPASDREVGTGLGLDSLERELLRMNAKVI